MSSLILEGYVVALGRNNSAPRSVDPATTSTPIQDALDIVDAAGGGEVRLPAGVVEETGPIRPYEETQIIGLGVELSKISITDRDADGILFDRDSGVSRVKLDGFALNGPAGTEPTGVAIHHTNRDTQDLFVGRLLFWGWNNSVYRVDEGVGPFQCRHDQLTIYECDAGDQDGLFEFRSWYGPANWFGTIAAYPSATVSGQNTTVFFSRGGTQTVDYLTMGGSAGIAVDQTWDSLIEFGNVHWEPTTNPTNPPAIVRLSGHGTAVIGSVKHVTGVADYVYELGYDELQRQRAEPEDPRSLHRTGRRGRHHEHARQPRRPRRPRGTVAVSGVARRRDGHPQRGIDRRLPGARNRRYRVLIPARRSCRESLSTDHATVTGHPL
ncbi:MAG: hypothetical protein U5K28_05275 [Halobacteriales archaeon]|nr:hypothetical protein [Halobacteriales archaeon]